MNKRFLTFVSVFVIAATSTLAQNSATKISSSLAQEFTQHNNVACLVLFSDKADVSAAKTIHGKEAKGRFVWDRLQETASKSQTNAWQMISAYGISQSGISATRLQVVNAIALRADQSLIAQLAALPEVKEVIWDAPQRSLQPVTATSQNRTANLPNWGIETIGANEVWKMGIYGQGAVIGGQDTGYDWTNEALKKTYRGWNGTTANHDYNWFDAIAAQIPDNPNASNCGYALSEPCDDNNHGTHTMGTMVGSVGVDSFGVAPGARWICARNMDEGYGLLSTYAATFQWFLAPTQVNGQNPDPSKAPHVINNSWSCPQSEGCDPSNFAVMQTAISNLRNAGVVVVGSAGNSGANCSTISAPLAIFDEVFTVGASNDQDLIAGFSSRGPIIVDGSNRLKPDVVAPGVGIYSCLPGTNAFASFSGTSMAGPHVAGLVGLLISANPQLAGEVDQIEDIIRNSATPLYTTEGCGGDQSTSLPNHTFGYGRINAIEAVRAAIATNVVLGAPSNSPKLYPNPSNGQFSFDISQQFIGAELQLFNLNAQTVFSATLNQTQNSFALPNLPDGVYAWKMVSGENVWTGKWTKSE